MSCWLVIFLAISNEPMERKGGLLASTLGNEYLTSNLSGP